MKIILLLLVTCFHFQVLRAQNESFGDEIIEVNVQSRFFHSINNIPNDFKTIVDLGLGANWNYTINKRLSINIGGTFGYSSFENVNYNKHGLLFVSEFKNTVINYFDHQKVNQFTFEVPLTIELNLFRTKSNTFGVVAGIVPQKLLFTKHVGNSWNGIEEIKGLPKVISFNYDYNYTFINDIYFRGGINFGQKIGLSNKIKIEGGFEISYFGDSVGTYIKTGFIL